MCVCLCDHLTRGRPTTPDHDAGTFQKILCEKRIVVMTTKTIYESFIRKYSALSGIDDNFLKRSHKVREEERSMAWLLVCLPLCLPAFLPAYPPNLPPSLIQPRAPCLPAGLIR